MIRDIEGPLEDVEYYSTKRDNLWAVVTVRGIRVVVLPTLYLRLDAQLGTADPGDHVRVRAKAAGPQRWVAVDITWLP